GAVIPGDGKPQGFRHSPQGNHDGGGSVHLLSVDRNGVCVVGKIGVCLCVRGGGDHICGQGGQGQSAGQSQGSNNGTCFTLHNNIPPFRLLFVTEQFPSPLYPVQSAELLHFLKNFLRDMVRGNPGA